MGEGQQYSNYVDNITPILSYSHLCSQENGAANEAGKSSKTDSNVGNDVEAQALREKALEALQSLRSLDAAEEDDADAAPRENRTGEDDVPHQPLLLLLIL